MALDQANAISLSRRAMKAELLDAETELQLAYLWRDHKDEQALHRLITAYMRLAISMASKFKRYGVPMNDLIQEAGLGLMKAAEKFDPDRGVRFSTYAVWWIKASVQDYVMRNWSLVRTGSTSSQKALFFNMRRIQAQLEREAMQMGISLDSDQLHRKIATEIGVPLGDVKMMDGRLSGSDYSLNATQSTDEEGREWIETLEDESEGADSLFEQAHDNAHLRKCLLDALSTLNDRQQTKIHAVVPRIEMSDLIELTTMFLTTSFWNEKTLFNEILLDLNNPDAFFFKSSFEPSLKSNLVSIILFL